MIATRRHRHLKLQSAGTLLLWLDASDATSLYDATSGGSLVAPDGSVARWQDKSGNAYHATQSTSGSRPVRKTNILNGRAVLRFDGTNDFMGASNTTVSLSSSGWIYLAVINKPLTNGVATNQRVFSSPSTGSQDYVAGLILSLATNAAVSPIVTSSSGTSREMRGFLLGNELAPPGSALSDNGQDYGGDIGEVVVIQNPTSTTSALRNRIRAAIAAKWKVPT